MIWWLDPSIAFLKYLPKYLGLSTFSFLFGPSCDDSLGNCWFVDCIALSSTLHLNTQVIEAAIGCNAWCFACIQKGPPFWHDAACDEAHGRSRNVSTAQRLLLGKFIASLPESEYKLDLAAAFSVAFSLEGAILLLELQFLWKLHFLYPGASCIAPVSSGIWSLSEMHCGWETQKMNKENTHQNLWFLRTQVLFENAIYYGIYKCTSSPF